MQLERSPAMNGTLLALQNSKQEVKGLWCSSEDELQEFQGKLEQKILASAKKGGEKKKGKASAQPTKILNRPTATPSISLPAPGPAPPQITREELMARAQQDGNQVSELPPSPQEGNGQSGMPENVAAMFANAGRPTAAPPHVPLPAPTSSEPQQTTNNDPVANFFAQFQGPAPNPQSAPTTTTTGQTVPASEMRPVPPVIPLQQHWPQLPALPPLPMAMPLPPPASAPVINTSSAIPAAGHFAAAVVMVTGGRQVNRTELQEVLYSLSQDPNFLEHVYLHLQQSGHG